MIHSWSLDCPVHAWGNGTCEGMIRWVCEQIQLSGIAPLKCLKLIIGSSLPATRLLGLLEDVGGFPFASSVYIEGNIDATHPSLPKTLVGPPRSLFLDVDLHYSGDKFLAESSSNAGSNDVLLKPKSAQNLIQYLRLIIPVMSFRIKPQAFGHFRCLKTLKFHRTRSNRFPFYPPAVEDDADNSFPRFWRQMVSEHIFVENLTYPAPEVEEAFITYLSAYPEPSLKVLVFHFDDIDGQFPSSTSITALETLFFTALPSIAEGLEELRMPMHTKCQGWCPDALPPFLIPFHQLVSLRQLTMSVNMHHPISGMISKTIGLVGIISLMRIPF